MVGDITGKLTTTWLVQLQSGMTTEDLKRTTGMAGEITEKLATMWLVQLQSGMASEDLKKTIGYVGRFTETATIFKHIPRQHSLVMRKYLSKFTSEEAVEKLGKTLLVQSGVASDDTYIQRAAHQLGRLAGVATAVTYTSWQYGGKYLGAAAGAATSLTHTSWQYGQAVVKYLNKSTGDETVDKLAKVWLVQLKQGMTSENAKRVTHYVGQFAEAVTAVRYSPRQYGLAMGKYLSTSTRAGIIDKIAKTWVVRLDFKHKGCKSSHININYKLTGLRDPHIPIPMFAVKAGEVATNALEAVGVAAFWIAILVDASRIYCAIDDDRKNTHNNWLFEHTTLTGASVAGSWLGSFGGAKAGSLAGSLIGGTTAFLIGGGIATVPLIAVCSLFGTAVGAYKGANYGRDISENFVEKLYSNGEKDE